MTEEQLSSKEYNEIGRAILDMVSTCKYVSSLTLDYQDLKGIGHLGVFTTPGGKYIRRDVVGGFQAVIPFQLVYRFSGNTNIQMLQGENLLDNIAEYLEGMKYPSLTDGRRIIKITMDSITYRSAAENDNSVAFTRTGTLSYEKE